MLTELNKRSFQSFLFTAHAVHGFHLARTLGFSHDSPSMRHVKYSETTNQLLASVIARAGRLTWHLSLRNTWNMLSGSCITENADVYCHNFVNFFICRYSSCGTAVAVAMTVDSRQATPAPPAATTWADRRRQAQTPASLGCPRHQRERWRRRRRRLKKMKRTRPAAAGRRTVRRLRLPPPPPPPGAGERRDWPPAAPCSPPTPWRCTCNQRPSY